MAATVVAATVLQATPASAAACQAPSQDFGSVSTTVSVPSNATYRIWSRMMAPDSTNNSYLLEVDGQNCYTVGGAGTTANTWTWIDHTTGNNKVDLALTQGSHNVKFIGRQAGVKLDRIVLTSDLQCTPVGNGDNCNAPADNTPPTVDITAPQPDSAVSGNAVAVNANASDAAGVTKVEFYVNNTLKLSDTQAPYNFQWDSTTEANGSQRLTVKAYDAAGNISSDSILVTVQNGDSQAPSAPSGVTATALAYNTVKVSWTASTDNVGVKAYIISRNGSVLTQVGAITTYEDKTANPNSSYSYQVVALDTSNNKSAASAAATVTTPSAPDTSAPTAPQQLTATQSSSQQINLKWAASTDNIGVTGYEVWRATAGRSAQRVATVNTTSYGDTNLQAKTEYFYYVKARDAAGNVGGASSTVNATTQEKVRKARVRGQVTDRAGRPIKNANVTITVEGVKYTATTNNRGRYQLHDIPNGRYTITYRAKSFSSKTVSLTVRDRTLTYDVQLRKR